MFKQITFILALLSLTACDTTDLNSVLGAVLNSENGLTSTEIGSGLKQALEIGISKGSDRLSRENGYFESPYKILLPEEARKVTDRLQNIPGFSNLEANVLEKINRGAEDAASKAKPIFVNAIKSMTITDALGILKGDKDAATVYLKRVTYQQLYNEFNPVIVESLDKFNARDYWSSAVNTYNRIPLINDEVDPDLDDYVTNKALDGLFSQVAKEELDIRNNIGARTTDLLRRVFAAQDN
ncbi:DUF4197 domain-containing protein [Lewinella cohaerens]|uniref:DUF4197 domain-containing protein n=1 Tax=Lewinella cohaerens TaxID=70995 RepID=UPI000380FAC3|nr:DUF4197 domain-containing protein [Lewinella cohaerens]